MITRMPTAKLMNGNSPESVIGTALPEPDLAAGGTAAV